VFDIEKLYNGLPNVESGQALITLKCGVAPDESLFPRRSRRSQQSPTADKVNNLNLVPVVELSCRPEAAPHDHPI
jgi:hypothetical protein